MLNTLLFITIFFIEFAYVGEEGLLCILIAKSLTSSVIIVLFIILIPCIGLTLSSEYISIPSFFAFFIILSDIVHSTEVYIPSFDGVTLSNLPVFSIMLFFIRLKIKSYY